jgi:hypothetical protein
MIGLMFFGAIALWGLVALGVGLGLSKLFRESWRGFAAFALIPLVFFAPVADEIIAYPQMKALCEQGSTRLVMDADLAKGREICYTQRLKIKDVVLLPPSISLNKYEETFIDIHTKKPVLEAFWYEAHAGYLNMPNGSSGGYMPLILGSCSLKTKIPREPDGTPTSLKYLNLKKVPCPLP